MGMSAIAVASPSPAYSADRLLAGLSLEITGRDAADLPAIAGRLAPGTRVSITFLPREDAARRLDAVRAVIDCGFSPVPHISARRIGSEAELEAYLDALAALGATRELFVVAGDADRPSGPYEDALAVIRSGLLARYGARHVGIGGYPDGHPRIDDATLWAALRDKAAAVADQGMGLSILTQFGFDADPALRWLAAVRAAGIAAPVRLGVPGPASATTLMRFAARCGVGASASVLRKYGLSLTRLMQTAGPDRYIAALLGGLSVETHGDVGLHVYPFGGLDSAVGWINDFAGRQHA